MLHQSITSLAVAERTGMLVRREEGAYRTKCPVCNSVLWLLEHGALCENSSCAFFAGSPLDLLKFQEGLGSYVQAVERMDTLFADRLSSRARGGAWPEISQAKAKRVMLEVFLRSYAARLGPRAVNLLHLDNWLRGHGFRNEAVDLSVFLLPVTEVKLLNDCAVSLGFLPVDMPAGPVIALPTFDTHHSVASVTFYNPFTHYNETLDVQDSRFSFFGMLHHTPKVQMIHITGTNNFDAALTNCRLALTSTRRLATAVRFKSENELNRFLPEHAVFHSNGLQMGLAEQLQQSSITLNFSQDMPGEAATQLSWPDFLRATILQGVSREGRINSSVRLMLTSLKLDTHTRQWLVSSFRRSGHGITAGELLAVFQTNLVYSNDKLRLYATPDGYQLVKTNAARELITNFVLDLRANVCFRETGALYFSGELSLDGQKTDVVMSAKDLESPATLESILQRHIILRGGDPHQQETLPIIHDRAGMKHVTAHLRETTAKLPQREGIDRLGWSADKKIFYGPTWKTMMDGTRVEQAFCLHPEIPVLEHFNTAEVKTRPLCSAPQNDTLRTLVSMVMACVARGYLNYPTHGVLIRQDAHIQTILERLFRAMGQTRGLTRSGSELAGVYGFPVLGYGYNLGQLNRAGIPMFSLSEQGLILSGKVSETEVEEAAIYLPHIIITTSEWLLATAGEGFARKPHVMHSTELMEEGAWLMEQVADIKWEFAYTAFATLEKLLTQTTHSELGNNWRYDFLGQKVLLTYDRLPTDPAFLEAELRNLSQTFEHIPQQKLMTMDAGSILGLLRHYYGKDAQLPMVTKPPK